MPQPKNPSDAGASGKDLPLFANRSFHGHVGAQLFGAFNDNLFKQLILFLAARYLFPGQDKQGLAAIVFALPFILFSGVAGDLSERLSKRSIVVLMKVLEIAIMVAGAIALQHRSWVGMLVVLFVMGAQSAFFGPAKYGIIPELVGKARLLAANGVISMTTFLAILLGQATAGPLLDRYGDRLWVTGAWCVGFAALGTALAALIKPLRALRPDTPIRPLGGLRASLRDLKKDRRVIHVLIVNALFWFNGAVMQLVLVGLGAPGYLDIPKDQNWRLSALLAGLATAIIVGSVCVSPVARWVRPGKLIAFGAVSMMLCQFGIAGAVLLLGAGAYTATFALSLVLGFTGAFFAVPVQTFLQDAPEEGTRGKTFAVNNFLNWTLILVAGAFYLTSSAMKLHPGIPAAAAGTILVAVLLVHRKSVLSIERPRD